MQYNYLHDCCRKSGGAFILPADILILAIATVPRVYNGRLLVLTLTTVTVMSYRTGGCV